jgi:DNA-binding NarL/FixJ family response regulator
MVVDDEPLCRAVLAEVVDATPGFETVHVAASGEEALRRLAERPADLVVMDVRMPGAGGVAAAREASRHPAHPLVILVSSDDRPDIAADPTAHGAAAFLRKDTVSARLLRSTWGQLALEAL